MKIEMYKLITWKNFGIIMSSWRETSSVSFRVWSSFGRDITPLSIHENHIP